MAKHSRRYKDSVFVDLFSEDKSAKENFLSLYNALHGTHLDASTELKPLKLEQAMYTKLSNDVSCLIDNKIIVLAEHQSTINENMPLRCLQYVARLYEQIQDPKAKYYRTLQKIPTPEFYVFYNGTEDYPETTVLKLSDAFIIKPEHAPLELTVQVLNINTDKANKILTACKLLEEYSLFVEAVRRHTALDKENGFEAAIKECIQNDILKEYLQRKSREVINMLLSDYDYDTDIAVRCEEAGRIAFAEGIEQGIQQGIEQGIEKGIEQGFADGSYRKALETAKLMKQANCETDFIMQMTGLTQEEVENL
ncbi:Rpn family recombination-promoting nuclease/putative transposase [Treponema parvum]|uniref:Rpn family recombination-promoting nuclease/putative transposase n=1 Tax=Treponema parvum TaxID=138851 RepID=A0A975IF04_9SPIR|nr:Rpn family recombination-promoting nuclease/putative transposase [Treponema parvum]QTQ14367.1 Rpn family recombination-promoting nuclease/putative transposase [Treponema parvum]